MAWCQTLKAQGDTPEEENKTGSVAAPGDTINISPD